MSAQNQALSSKLHALVDINQRYQNHSFRGDMREHFANGIGFFKTVLSHVGLRRVLSWGNLTVTSPGEKGKFPSLLADYRYAPFSFLKFLLTPVIFINYVASIVGYVVGAVAAAALTPLAVLRFLGRKITYPIQRWRAKRRVHKAFEDALSTTDSETDAGETKQTIASGMVANDAEILKDYDDVSAALYFHQVGNHLGTMLFFNTLLKSDIEEKAKETILVRFEKTYLGFKKDRPLLMDNANIGATQDVRHHLQQDPSMRSIVLHLLNDFRPIATPTDKTQPTWYLLAEICAINQYSYEEINILRRFFNDCAARANKIMEESLPDKQLTDDDIFNAFTNACRLYGHTQLATTILNMITKQQSSEDQATKDPLTQRQFKIRTIKAAHTGLSSYAMLKGDLKEAEEHAKASENQQMINLVELQKEEQEREVRRLANRVPTKDEQESELQTAAFEEVKDWFWGLLGYTKQAPVKPTTNLPAPSPAKSPSPQPPGFNTSQQ